MTRKTYIVLSISIVLIAGGLVGWWIWGRRPPATEVSLGQTLYETNCAVCHGLKGDGTGEAAYLLQPKPRNFRAGKFRLVTSENGQPTRDDLFRTVTNGMPGTAMLSWVNLPESDRLALVD
ncbi:MAG: cytochrome c, partial [Acidobacteria bacterium]|nr:cytochrome c [Acidobacteriota bacterium]